jgi:alpha-L-fucosidase
VWDIERGQSDRIEELPWQTCTCIGSWHYDRRIYDNRAYKSAQTVLHTLIDVVSKNGNLLLSVPRRGDGSLDSDEIPFIRSVHGLEVSMPEDRPDGDFAFALKIT